MEGQADTYAGIAKFSASQRRGRIGRVPIGNPGKPFSRDSKHPVLFFGERVVGFVGVGHMRRQAFDFERGQPAQVLSERDGLIEDEAEAVQPGIDFHMYFRDDTGGKGRLR
jgi:hypothetical protein